MAIPASLNSGYLCPGHVVNNEDAVDPNEYYEIERILRAVKLGGKYKLLVKW